MARGDRQQGPAVPGCRRGGVARDRAPDAPARPGSLRPVLNATGNAVAQRLEQGLAALGIEASAAQRRRLMAFAVEMERWSHAYNLTAVRDLGAIITRHVLDSLAVLPHLHGASLLDVGSGAGLPGVPLAIMRPDVEVTLLDAVGKKIRFLEHVKRTLALDNAEPVQARAEDWQPGRGFDCLTWRAVGPLAETATAVRHLAAPGARLLAMKGLRPDVEIAALPDWLELVDVVALSVPDLHETRHLVIMCPTHS